MVHAIVVRRAWVEGVETTFKQRRPETRQHVVNKLLGSSEESDLEINVYGHMRVQKTLKVRVEFFVVRPSAGLVFGRDGWTVYTAARQHPSSARQWMPCADTMEGRSTWDMFISVPACTAAMEPMTVVASGELSSLVADPRDPRRRVYRYVVSTQTAAWALGFAAGPFVSACALDGRGLETGGGGHNARLRQATVEAVGGVFAFAGRGYDVSETCGFLPEALAFYSQEFGAYPYASYKVVFVEGLGGVVTCASLTLVDAGLVHSRGEIEAAYEARRVLGHAAAQQWFGTHVTAETWADQWLVVGLAGHMAGQFVRHNLGTNEQRYRLRRDMVRLSHADVNQKPLSYPGQGPWTAAEAEFGQLKAPIVLYMLDRRMLRGGVALGLARVVPKVLVAAMGGDLGPANAVGTAWFLRTCRRVSGVDIADFATQWVYGAGCPVFHVGYAFNRKKLAVEITLHQECTNTHATAPWARPQLFAGPMTARIREADGTPYEHVLDIRREPTARFEVQFNTKYKRIRRSTRRFHMRQMAAAAEELNINAEVLGLDDADDSNIALFGAENAREKHDWRVVEWGEADEHSLASATFEWIRMDSDLDWACVMHFEQPDFMWAAQLQKDRDVVAQLDAVDALQHLPSAAASTTLMRTVMDARVFYRVRADAALALARLATPQLSWVGLHHLVKIYKRRFCLPPASGGSGDDEALNAPRLPRPNNFANISEYFTQLAVLAALSNVRDRYGEAPPPARRLILQALRFNDNSENVFSDCRYTAALVRALSNCVISSSRFAQRFSLGAPEDAVLLEIERVRKLDLLVPSFQNVVTCACLDALVRLAVVQRTQPLLNTAMLCAMADARACAPVRERAICGLLLHWGLRDKRAAHFFVALASDTESPVVARTTARFVMLAVMLRAMSFGQQHSSLLFQEQQQQGSHLREHIDTDARLVGGLEALIDDAWGDSPQLRLLLASSAYDAALDPDAHRLLALLHALVYQVKDSTIPPQPVASRKKLKIKMGSRKARGSRKGSRVRSNMSSDSEDTPLATSASAALNEDEFVDIGDSYGLPPIAGTRPPPITASDRHMDSPAYEPPSRPEPAAVPEPQRDGQQTPSVKVKLKLKLGKTASPVRVASPPYSSTLPKISSPLAASPNRNQSPSPAVKPEPAVESVASSQTPAEASEPATSGISGDERKFLFRLLRKLGRNPSAFPFLGPVDVIRDGCPTYYEVIKHPMDLGTIKMKLEQKKYLALSDFVSDIRLMFNNCYLFNPPSTPVYNMGKEVEAAFDAEWEKLKHYQERPKADATKKRTGKASDSSVKRSKPSKKKPRVQDALDDPEAIIALLDQTEPQKPQEVPGDWSSTCRRILLRLQAQPTAMEFLLPVDPIKQGVPTYPDIVKTPMDLGTIRKKLDRHQYHSEQDFYDDVKLVFSNCFLFNPPDSMVYKHACALQDFFDVVWKQQTKDGDADGSSLPPDLLMNEVALDRAKSIINKLKLDEHLWPFILPVDPVALGIPVYFDIVKNPMDFSTILKKLDKKVYKYVSEFVADIQLIVDDCFLFNLPDTPVHECGKKLHQAAFDLLQPDHWDRWLARP
ncbi:hypothetical protein EV183_001708 [Coemansia sp. RSA 2336]|nr:hypothetical protein EV183_001708 [Coemansia sp. RSA 2336]